MNGHDPDPDSDQAQVQQGPNEKLWKEIEDKYWDSVKTFREEEDRRIAEESQIDADEQKAKLEDALFNKFEDRKRLLKQLEKIDLEYQEIQESLDAVDQKLEADRAALLAERAKEDEAKRQMFRDYRPVKTLAKTSDEDADVVMTDKQSEPQQTNLKPQQTQPKPSEQTQPESQQTEPKPTEPRQPEPKQPEQQQPGQKQTEQKQNEKQPRTEQQRFMTTEQQRHGSAGRAAVKVVDSAGQLIGQLRPISLDNAWVRDVMQLPIQRVVEIRASRKFTPEMLETIYEPSDAKGAKWLSCYVQATGEIQSHACHTCAKNGGPFSTCVIIGGSEFPRCGNCEWNRQGCHGGTLHVRPRSRHSAAGETVTASLGKSPGRRAAAAAAEQTTISINTTATRGFTSSSSAGPKQLAAARKLLPGARKAAARPDSPALSTFMSETPEAETPSNPRGRPWKNLPEINKSVLLLRHDGIVFTEPEIVRGVPLAKISPGHPYWDPEWPSLQDYIQPQLQKWVDKYDEYVNNVAKPPPPSSKFLAGRQVNRGKAILRYLKEGELHPYQIVAKPYINKSLVSYDTLFRLVQVLEELAKFNTDVSPSQWLRQRLHEISVEQGDSFNLGKTVHDLYHDPKVTTLRSKSGFGNIGRPSGYRMATGDSGTPKKPARPLKRKEPHESPKTTPGSTAKRGTKNAAVQPAKPAQSTQPAQPAQPAQPTRPAQPAAIATQQAVAAKEPAPQIDTKKRRLSSASAANLVITADDLEYSGYTSQDSFSEDHVMRVDWRVYQVKHQKISTNTLVTQYWHWVGEGEGGAEENIFEHQVLKDVLPNKKVTWGVYKDPIDFHLRMSELTDITFAKDSLKIIISTKEIEGVTHRGNLLADFKRERTKRRFLAFMRKRGVKLVKTNGEYIQREWDRMDSDVLPHYDSD
ncbi:hypothetical protein B0H63DRAFT_400251 [Podospora didyma]|uniref:Uncharacterized protein n=1 Tax=Podospora didyma TaxID=330526 RepID=A0AAE0N8W6_9PEZI|nr:hypothetical protein B0H63DRAFT_400251 [Podospora didyma]